MTDIQVGWTRTRLSRTTSITLECVKSIYCFQFLISRLIFVGLLWRIWWSREALVGAWCNGNRFLVFFNGLAYRLTVNEPWCVSILGYGRGVFAPGRSSDRTRSLEGDSSTEPWMWVNLSRALVHLCLALYNWQLTYPFLHMITVLGATWSLHMPMLWRSTARTSNLIRKARLASHWTVTGLCHMTITKKVSSRSAVNPSCRISSWTVESTRYRCRSARTWLRNWYVIPVRLFHSCIYLSSADDEFMLGWFAVWIFLVITCPGFRFLLMPI